MTSAGALREPLERLYREFDYGARVARDAIEFPLRYPAPDDREVVALLTACLAYGRVDLFSRALEGVLRVMAPSPAAFVREFDARRDAGAFTAFLYRFNRPRATARSRSASRPATPSRPAPSAPRSSALPGRSWRRTSVTSSRAAAARAATATCSRCPRAAGPASACTCSCAGWCGVSGPTSACGRRSRRRGC